jgi:homoserine O-acetyltransferase
MNERTMAMNTGARALRWMAAAGLALSGALVGALAWGGDMSALPKAVQGDWVARDFRFHTGQVLPELRLHYTTLGSPANPAVLVLHGTSGSAAKMLTPEFAGELFGPGQPLDASRHFIILPDALGHGESSKPSDGLRARFPAYDYDDIVEAQYRLVAEGLGVKHLRLVIGHSMGGMLTWLWGEQHPAFMDALVPMASQPTAMSGRNWMMRRMIIDTIRNDPAWDNGNYRTQPPSLRVASAFFGIATNGGTQAYQKMAPTREAADKVVDARLAAPFEFDANDYLYQWQASSDYDPGPGLPRIRAALMAINAADDERNPPQLAAAMERELQRLPSGSYYLIPASEDTRGHGTTNIAKFWKQPMQQWLATVPVGSAAKPAP